MLRPDIQRLLLQRFERRVIVMRAGAGFGKTTALAQAAAQNVIASRGTDVWLTCETGDKDDEYLLAGLSRAFGRDLASVTDIAAAVASLSPSRVCLILDDAHEIPADSDGARLVAAIVDALPLNGAVLLSTRGDVQVPLSRLDAQGSVGWIDSGDLAFSDEDLASYSEATHTDPARLAGFGGWPALVALAARTRNVADFLHEEVLTWLTPDQMLALEATVALGSVDGDLLHQVVGVSPEVLNDLPLVDHVEGRYMSHALWADAVDEFVPAERLQKVQRDGIRYLLASGSVERAVEASMIASQPDLLEEAVRAAIVANFVGETSNATRWLSTMRSTGMEGPAVDYLAGIVAQRNSSTASQCVELLDRAASGFHGRGWYDCEVKSLVEVGYWHYTQNDMAGLLKVAAATTELASEGVESAKPFAMISDAFMALVGGRASDVIDTVGRIHTEVLTPGFAAVADWLNAQALEILGHPSVELADASTAHGVQTNGFALLAYSSRWRNGDIEDLLGDWNWGFEPSTDRDEFNRRIWLGIAASGCGDTPTAIEHHDIAKTLAGPSTAVEIPLKILELCIARELGDDRRSRRILEGMLADHPLNDVNRITYNGIAGYAVREIPESAAYFLPQGSGPLKRRDVSLGQALRGLDQGSLDGFRSMDWPEQHGGLVSAVLLRGATEVVAGAWAVGRPEARDAAAWMARTLGEPARARFRDLYDHPVAEVADAAREIVAGIPVPPKHRLAVGVLGPAAISIDGIPTEDPNWRRERVRSLLGLLAHKQKVTREYAMTALWPDSDDAACRRNLRSTLNLLHKVVEPDRGAGEAPYFIRSDGPSLELWRCEQLEVDVWRFDKLLDEAARFDGDGVPETALGSLLSAIELYRGEYLVDAPYDDWSGVERDRLRSRFVAAAVRAGELLMAFGRFDEALRVSVRALEAEPWSEAAHRVIVAAHMEKGDRAGALRALDRCHAALDDIGGPVEDLTLMIERRLGRA